MKLFSKSSRALCTCINKHNNVINAKVIILDTYIHERGLNRRNKDMQLDLRGIGNLLGCDSILWAYNSLQKYLNLSDCQDSRWTPQYRFAEASSKWMWHKNCLGW